MRIYLRCFVLLALAASVAYGADTVAPALTPVVVDSNGKLVGQVVSAADPYAGSVLVAMTVDDDLVFVRLARVNQDLVWQPLSVYFAQPDCQGSPYVLQPQATKRDALVFNDVLYVSDNTNTIPNKILPSRIDGGSPCFNVGSSGDAVLLRSTGINLRTVYSYPLAVTVYLPKRRAVGE